MRGTTYRVACLLLAGLALAPGGVWAQSNTGMQYAPADPQVPLPYGSTRPEDGGFYTTATVGLYRQTNPLGHQPVAVRGLFAYEAGGRTVTQNQLVVVQATPGPGGNPVIVIPTNLPGQNGPAQPNLSFDTGNLPPNVPNGVVIIGGVQTAIIAGLPAQIQQAFFNVPTSTAIGGLFNQPGFLGSNQPVLDVNNLVGPPSFELAHELGVGWKFRDGSSVQLNWMYMYEAQYRSAATLAPQVGPNVNPADNPGLRLENTFLFAPVFNFPPEYAGADFKVNVLPGTQDAAGNLVNVNPQQVYGIWNGASIMTLQFRQRFQQWEIVYREPIWETETYRVNGLVGPRYAWFWEKFKWVTTSIGQDPTGAVLEGPQFVGIYSNITSNRMYGVHAGCEQEWYLGRGFAVHLKTEAALFLDSVKEKAKYETAAKYLGLPQNKRTQGEMCVVPELQASLGMMWYPTEFVQIYARYDAMAFFNTRSSPQPIDFDYANIRPQWESTFRLIDGFQAGIGFTF